MAETTPTKTATMEQSLAPTAPVPPAEVVAYSAAPPAVRAEIDKAVAEIDLDDSNSILFFGTSAQAEVTSVADEMLEGVRNKDTGPAGQALNDMVSTLRGFALDDLDPKKKRRLLRAPARPRKTDREGAATVRTGTRPDRYDQQSPRRTHQHADERHRHARPAVRQDARLLPQPRHVHRRRRRMAAAARHGTAAGAAERRRGEFRRAEGAGACATCARNATTSNGACTT